MHSWKERLPAGLAYLLVLPFSWLAIEVLLQYVVAGRTLSDLIVPHPVPRVLPSGVPEVLAAAVVLVVWLGYRRRDPWVAGHVLQALGAGGVFALGDWTGPLVREAIVRTYATDRVMVCAETPGCTIMATADFLFGALEMAVVAVMLLGLIQALAGAGPLLGRRTARGA